MVLLWSLFASDREAARHQRLLICYTSESDAYCEGHRCGVIDTDDCKRRRIGQRKRELGKLAHNIAPSRVHTVVARKEPVYMRVFSTYRHKTARPAVPAQELEEHAVRPDRALDFVL